MRCDISIHFRKDQLIREIEASIQIDDMNNDALGPMFLLGYSSQVKDLYTKREHKEENENVDN